MSRSKPSLTSTVVGSTMLTTWSKKNIDSKKHCYKRRFYVFCAVLCVTKNLLLVQVWQKIFLAKKFTQWRQQDVFQFLLTPCKRCWPKRCIPFFGDSIASIDTHSEFLYNTKFQNCRSMFANFEANRTETGLKTTQTFFKCAWRFNVPYIFIF